MILKRSTKSSRSATRKRPGRIKSTKKGDRRKGTCYGEESDNDKAVGEDLLMS